jgi:hypothetical protein
MKKIIKNSATESLIENITKKYIPFKSSEIGIYDLNQVRKSELIKDITSLIEGKYNIIYTYDHYNTGPR